MQKVLLSAVVAASLLSGVAYAAPVGPYLGAKVGSYMVDDSESNKKYDDGTSFGVYGGYDFGSGLSVELEYNTSSGNDISVKNVKIGEYDFSNFGVYGAYRFYPSLYKGLSLKAKIGVISEDIDKNYSFGVASESNSDTGLSFGVGAGFAITPQVSIEGEYTVIEQDVDLLSLGLTFKL
jgi:opacity protein-like surface antigen